VHYLKMKDSHALTQAYIQLILLSMSCLLMLSAIVMLSLLRNSKNNEAKRRNILDPDLVRDLFPFTSEWYKLRPVRKLLVYELMPV